jgi:hypothetical protein
MYTKSPICIKQLFFVDGPQNVVSEISSKTRRFCIEHFMSTENKETGGKIKNRKILNNL